MKRFQAHLKILPSSQQRLFRELTATPTHFVLYGGTALALRLGHRISVDFDFFTNKSFSPFELEKEIIYLNNRERLQSADNTLHPCRPRGACEALLLWRA